MKRLARNPARIALALALAAIVVTGCNVKFSVAGQSIRVTRTFSAKSSVSVPSNLTVDVPVGNVTIKAGAADATEVSVEGTLGAEDQAALDAVNVSLERKDAEVSVKATGPKGKNWKADLTLVVPPRTSLTLTSGVGDVTITGLTGTVRATEGVGNITLEKATLTGDASVTSGTGNVTIGVASWPKDASLKAESGVGNVKVHVPAALGLDLDATTGVGNLKLKGLEMDSGASQQKSVVGATTRGRTKAEPEGRRLSAKSGTGNVTIEN